MDRDRTSYLVLHYLVLIAVILVLVAGLERVGVAVPFWLGLLIALGAGFFYPRAVRRLGVAPTGWERR